MPRLTLTRPLRFFSYNAVSVDHLEGAEVSYYDGFLSAAEIKNKSAFEKWWQTQPSLNWKWAASEWAGYAYDTGLHGTCDALDALTCLTV